MTDRLANIRIEYVIATAVVLLMLRLALGRYKGRLAKSAAEIVESALIAIVLVFLVIRPFVVQAFYIPSGSMLPTLQVRDHILVNKFVYRFREPEYGDIVVFKSPPAASGIYSGYLGARGDQMAKIICLTEWNKVVGRVDGTFGSSGEVKIQPLAGYYRHFEGLKELCVAGRGTYCRILGIQKISLRDGAVIAKFAGIDDTPAAEALSGSEVRVGEKDYIKRIIGKPGDIIEVKNASVYRNGGRLEEPYIAEPLTYDMQPFEVPAGMLFVMGDNRNDSKDSHIWGALDRRRVIGKAMVRFWPMDRIGLVR